MSQDARERSSSAPLQAKLCVIGSDLAGILVALESEGLGHDVLLLEAGDKTRDKQQRAALAGEVSTGEHEPVITTAPETARTLAKWSRERWLSARSIHYRVHERDRNSYYASLELIAAGLTRSPPAGARLTLPSREEFVAGAALGDGTDQMGLTRMIASAADGGVEADGCDHSCPNLFIASTAVFPTTGAAPATLTLAALSLRLAQHLDKLLRSSVGVV